MPEKKANRQRKSDRKTVLETNDASLPPDSVHEASDHEAEQAFSEGAFCWIVERDNEVVDEGECALERRAVGRYTLDEAADLLNVEAGEGRDSMLGKLIREVARGELPAYPPERHERMVYEQPEDVCSFYEEVYWDDLNNWLSIKEHRMSYRFPMPTGPDRSKHQIVDRSDTPQAEPGPQPRRDILSSIFDEAAVTGRAPSDVFVHLQKLARDRVSPFTGEVREQDGAPRFQSNSGLRYLTLGAVRKRLGRLRKKMDAKGR